MPSSYTLKAYAGRGSGIFDLHGNLIGLVYSSTTEELQRRLVEEKLWPTEESYPPAFFHGLNAILKFMQENNIKFHHQVVGKSKPMQGNATGMESVYGIPAAEILLHGFVGHVVYMVLCRSNDYREERGPEPLSPPPYLAMVQRGR